MPNLSDLFSAGGFLKWDGAGNTDADYSSQTPAQLAADAAFTGAFVSVDVIAPAATGTAATDTANLQAALDATPAGGTLRIPSGTYNLNAALTRATSIRIEGEAANPKFLGHAAGGNAYEPQTPYMVGSVLRMTVAATDILSLTGSAISVNLHNVALVFADGLASTGHGVVSLPPTHAGERDTGLESFHWQNVHVYGHDGDHFGMHLTNPLDGTISHFRSYGGGGIYLEANSALDNLGNITFLHPYVLLSKAGTAGGIVHSSQAAGPGLLNLLCYVRPQVNCFGDGANASQPTYDDTAGAGEATMVTLVAPDFESSGGNPYLPGTSTFAVGSIQVAGYVYGHTKLGYLADTIGAGPHATAIGENTEATGNGSVAIGTDSGGVGASTSTIDEFVLGTPNHTVVVPGILEAKSIPVLGGYKAGWYSSTPGNSGTATSDEGRIEYLPLYIPISCSVDRLWCEVVSTPGSVGAVVRLGIYEDLAGIPGALLLDGGTVDATSTGIKELTITQALTPGLWWLAAVVQGAAGTRPTMRRTTGAGSGAFQFVGPTNVYPGFPQAGYRSAAAAAAGALPATALVADGNGAVIRQGVRFV